MILDTRFPWDLDIKARGFSNVLQADRTKVGNKKRRVIGSRYFMTTITCLGDLVQGYWVVVCGNSEFCLQAMVTLLVSRS